MARVRRSPHPGVKLVARRRAGGVTHYGRVLDRVPGPGGEWVDAWRDVNLNDLGMETERQRRLWAEKTSRDLFALRRARAMGEAPPARTLPGPATERYLDHCRARLGALTVKAYRATARELEAWLAQRCVLTTEAITPQLLFAFREHLELQGAEDTTLANKLSRARAMLNWWRRAGLLPQVSAEAIREQLAAPELPRPLAVTYQPAELRSVLGAGLAVGWEAAASIALYLLLGLRYSELAQLEWPAVRLGAAPAGEIEIGPRGRARAGRGRSKTGAGRLVDLSVCPAAAAILDALPRRAPRVAPWLRSPKAAQHLAIFPTRRMAGVPEWTWQHLRHCCATYLVCSPGIYGASSVYMEARQLGHSVQVAERFYLGLIRGIPPEAKTLEAAMGIEDLAADVARLAKAAPRPVAS